MPPTDEAPLTGVEVDELLEQLWETRFEELVAFRGAHGHCRVPSGWQVNQPLANWVRRQRESHQKGRLAPERARRLEEIGFVWQAAGAEAEEHWARRLAALEAFHAEHGHLKVSRSDPQWANLAEWLTEQRTFQRRGELKPQRKAQLEALGIDWDPTRKHTPHTNAVPGSGASSAPALLPPGDGPPTNEIGRWEYFYAHLLAFKREQGHVKVPPDWPPNPALAAWVQEQRPGYEYGRLHFDQIARLEKLGFEWRTNDDCGMTAERSESNDETLKDERRPRYECECG